MENKIFDGFDMNWFKRSYFKYPKPLADMYWGRLNPSERMVLDFILRRTVGFKKGADYISLRQFTWGLRGYNGEVIDYGCGVSSTSTVSKALDSLEIKGFIKVLRKGKGRTSKICLVIKGHSQGMIQSVYQKASTGVLNSEKTLSASNTTIDKNNKGQYKLIFNFFREELKTIEEDPRIRRVIMLCRIKSLSAEEILSKLKEFQSKERVDITNTTNQFLKWLE